MREPVLDEWLRKRALGNPSSVASRTFVVVDSSGRVMGCYALAAGAVAHEAATSAVPRNMPNAARSWFSVDPRSIGRRRA